MKVPVFTLIHGLTGQIAPMFSPGSRVLGKLNRNLQNSISLSMAEAGGDANSIEQVASQLARQDHVITVGLWDLGAWVGGLPKMIQALNESTPAVTIFEVQAAIPSGLLWGPERIGSWAEERLGRKLTAREQHELAPCVLNENVLNLAGPVRRDLGIDYLIALTPAQIAGEVTDQDGRTVHCDFFSGASVEDRTAVVSTYQLRELAAETGRAYEYAVGIVILAPLLVMMNPELDYHPNTGCLFDYNYDRHDITNNLHTPVIQKNCLDKMAEEFRDPGRAMLGALDHYPRPMASRVEKENSGADS